jgi:hypothetical protein
VFQNVTVKDEPADLFVRLEGDEDEDAAVDVALFRRRRESVVPQVNIGSGGVCTGNLIRVDEMTESPKLVEWSGCCVSS